MSDIDPLLNAPAENPFELEENLVQKGDFVDIRRKIPSLQNLRIAAGWDHKMFEDNPLDIDLSAFLLNRSDQTRDNEDFVYYNNEKTCEGAIRHQGDSRTGAGDGDDETIVLDLNGIPFDITKICFTLSIYSGPERDQDFSQVRNLYLRMVNSDDDHEIFRFKLPEAEYKGAICIKVGELVREGPKWYFSAIGDSVQGGLAAIATQYGMVVQT